MPATNPSHKMKTLESSVQGEFEAKGSRFLCFLLPFSGAQEFHAFLANLKPAHQKAVHFVYAYREINELGQIVERSSDDGEPKGSSGVPVLNVLRGEELVACGAIVVRYFGGTLLGVGGLVRAYTKATQEALKSAKDAALIRPYVKLESLSIRVAYSHLNALQYQINSMGLACEKEFLSDKVALHIRGEKHQLDALLKHLSEHFNSCFESG